MEFVPSPQGKELKLSIFLRRRREVSKHLVQKYVSWFFCYDSPAYDSSGNLNQTSTTIVRCCAESIHNDWAIQRLQQQKPFTYVHMITRSASLGYHTMMDAASCANMPFLAYQSFQLTPCRYYKMFGPTGVGALIVKKSFLKQLRRPWFAGGTVGSVQAPGTLVTPALNLHEQFEVKNQSWSSLAINLTSLIINKDGTVNYLHLPAMKDGLCFLSAYLPFHPLRVSSPLLYLSSALTPLRHGSTGNPVVRILSKLPSRRVRTVGEQSDVGSVMSLVFLGVNYSRTPTPDGHSSLHYVYSPWEKCCQIFLLSMLLRRDTSRCGQARAACAIQAVLQPC